MHHHCHHQIPLNMYLHVLACFIELLTYYLLQSSSIESDIGQYDRNEIQV